jgi:DNA-binding NarL/FixJ family response regulator
LTSDERRDVIVIVDDHALMGEVLAMTLRQRGYEAYYVSANGVTCERITSACPRVVLLDICFGDDSFGGVNLLAALMPHVPVIAMLTGVDDPAVLAEAIAGGARGVIGKDQSVDEVVAQIETLLRRGTLVSPAERDRAVALASSNRHKRASREERLASLTTRERIVLEQFSAGATVADIARHECVSIATVRSHVRAVLQKLDVHSQVAAVALYLGRA